MTTRDSLSCVNSVKMSTVRPMTAMDLFRYNPCNLDHLTETYNVGFYLEYLSKWPHLCKVIERHDGQIEAYSSFPSRTTKANPHQMSESITNIPPLLCSPS